MEDNKELCIKDTSVKSSIEEEPQLDLPTKQELDLSEKVACNSSVVVSGDEDKTHQDDVYSYTKRDDFTSEIFKIEVKNLPKHINYQILKKHLKNLDLNPIKIKLIGYPTPKFAFVTFKNDADRDEALTKLEGHEWKSSILTVKKASPVVDPLIEKRKLSKKDEKREDKREDKRAKFDSQIENLSDEQLTNAINDQVTPIWKMSYDQQIEMKGKKLDNILISLRKEISRLEKEFSTRCPLLFKWIMHSKVNFDGKICPRQEVKRSPLITGYRNKCEFNIGSDKTIGFRLGLYKDGSMRVVSPPDDCPLINEFMKESMKVVQKYIKDKSHLDGFNHETYTGHYRQVTVRTSDSDCMIILAIHTNNVSQDQLEEEKEMLTKYLSEQSEVKMTSLYLYVSQNLRELSSSRNLQHLSGNKYIFETMNNGDRDLTFRISPFAFFQGNTRAAELCYQTIAQLIELTPQTVLLDICCGTGTIGIYLASKVKKVIGIELECEAVEDARENAKLNNINNIEFIQAKVEDVIKKTIESLLREDDCVDDLDLVAILDPPRAGLHKTVTQALRNTSEIKRLVYVSCEPEMAKRNFIELIRPTSSSYRGVPFVPTNSIPVDMFPHTNHCELVLLFERVNCITF